MLGGAASAPKLADVARLPETGMRHPPPLIDILGERMSVPLLVDERFKDHLQFLDLQGK